MIADQVAVIAGVDDLGVVGEAGGVECGQDAARIGVEKAAQAVIIA